jgi:outer membrane biosynthesis protein TonB
VSEETPETREEQPTEEPTVEEQPSEAPTPTEEPVAEKVPEEVYPEVPSAERIPNIFMVGSFEGGRALVVLDEEKAYPMDEKADSFVREHNIPILANYPEGVTVVGSDRAADLTALAKKLEAQT